MQTKERKTMNNQSTIPKDNQANKQKNDEEMRQAVSSIPSSATAPISGDKAKEVGGPQGLEPTRYGDWERKGRCVDF